MNMRQSLRAANKRIESLEHYNRRCKLDITAYNQVIDGLIAGNLNPCEWCEELSECQSEKKGHGCENWMLKDLTDEKGDEQSNDGRTGEVVTEGVSLEGCSG